MKKNIIKKATLALVLSLGLTVAQAYTYEEVSNACASVPSNDTNQEIGTCIYNTCMAHGCTLSNGAEIGGN